MAIAIDVDENRGLTTFTIEGSFTNGDIMDATRHVWPAQPTGRSLWDLRQATPGPCESLKTNETLARFAERLHKSAATPGKTAIVAGSGAAAFGHANQFGMLADDLPSRRFRVFTEMGAALGWLESESEA